MRLVVDANIIISGLLKDSAVRRIIISSGHDLYTPRFCTHEILANMDVICKKDGLSKQENLKVLSTLLGYMHEVDVGFYEKELSKAYNIMKKIDVNDTPYLALALSFDCDGIWTEDKHFEKQDKVKVWKTKDFI